MKKTIKHIRIERIKDLVDKNELILQPNYQRKFIWDNEKKVNIIDSIQKNWVLPPVICIKRQGQKSLEVLDGQQRLTSIYDFLRNNYMDKTSVFYNDLSIEKKALVDKYELVFFIIEDIQPDAIGEYFYRLNDQIALTASEKRNALEGDFNTIVKGLVHEFELGGFNDLNLTISNQRFEYEEIISKLCVYVDQGMVSEDLDLSLYYYYKGEKVIGLSTIEKIRQAMTAFCSILKQLRVNEDLKRWDENNSITCLYILATYPLKYAVNQSDFNRFIIDFERKRLELEMDIQSRYSNNMTDENIIQLLKVFNSRMKYQPESWQSIAVRELIIRILCFNTFEHLLHMQNGISMEEEVLFDTLMTDDEVLTTHDVEFMLTNYLEGGPMIS